MRVVLTVVGVSLVVVSVGVWRLWSTTSPALVAAPRLSLPEATPAGPASAAIVSRRVGHTFGGWTVVKEISIHRVVVMTIEAAQLENAPDIAALAVEPYQIDHFEALVYFVAPAQTGPPAFRIRWTPSQGFIQERF